jgi:micrococcal nuclease
MIRRMTQHPVQILLLLVAATLPTAGARSAEVLDGPVAASVVEVIDGDTIAVTARVWLGLEMSSHVRIRGIDTPELHATCAAEKAMAEAAKDRLASLRSPAAPCGLPTSARTSLADASTPTWPMPPAST